MLKRFVRKAFTLGRTWSKNASDPTIGHELRKNSKMTFKFEVPTRDGSLSFSVEPGTSIIFVGANGGGKTRLAVHIEKVLALTSHRISAHRALILNPSVPKISEKSALRGLRIGNFDERNEISHRTEWRWRGKEATFLLNDFDFLIQALFAEQANKSLETHKKA
jgi:ATPase subunit of ABC transporter with duplicated ATPase domains